MGDEFAPLAVDPGWEVEAPLATTRLRRRSAWSRLSWASLRQLAKQVSTLVADPGGNDRRGGRFSDRGIPGRCDSGPDELRHRARSRSLTAITNVEVKLDGETISIEGLDDPLQLRPGPHELIVTGEGLQAQSYIVHGSPRRTRIGPCYAGTETEKTSTPATKPVSLTPRSAK